ncbi:hypothetical protein [Streptomyces sp. NPDC059639]|uniref:hypothetical protein n=1 Tax=Streptomyces sp. NPDC059639 TaxID=3346891 RepID=UPI00369609CB
MPVAQRTIDVLTRTARQLSGGADPSGLLDNALKGQGDHPKGYEHAVEVCEAEIVDDGVTLTPILVVGSNAARITPNRIKHAYDQRVGRPVTMARIRVYSRTGVA